MKKNKKILVDMTCSILHHGHIRLLKKASKYGKVIVALTSDKEVIKHKKFRPPLNFNQRKEILSSIKYVSEVIKSSYFINEKFLTKHNISYLVHGTDNSNMIPEKYIKTFQRTKKISSSIIRRKLKKN